ncbi:MAG: COR domain-containing protein, partial [archaeon]|nr:COR domain-containing protein [archaeon]
MALPENRMATLILSNNSIGDAGLHSIFQALKTNTSLTSLDLEKNDLTAKALRGCLEPLRQSNFTLSFLNMGAVKKKKSLSRKQFSKSDDPLAILQALVAQNKTVFDCLYRDAKTVLLSDRKLSKVPDLLIPLGPNLTRLDLSQNLLTAVPDWFGDMSNLVSLNLAGNLLETLPDSLGLLEKLCTLVLTDNKLVKIPEAIVLLGHLENLFLENNHIHTLPTGVGSLGKLRILQLDGNPVVLAKRRSAVGDKSSALDILKERVWMGTETRDSFQMKLTILGRGNVGKTTLLRALKLLDVDKSLHNFRDVMRKSPNVATDGIEFDQWSVSRSNNRLVFTVLDCAGQSVYHLTHQFFLTGKSLFLVVFSLQDGNFANEIEYWLNAISGFCGNSLPVLVIGTHIDCEGVTKEYVKSLFQYLHRTVAHKFPMIRGYFGVSCTSGEGVSDLIDQMMNAVSSLPWLPVKIPVPFDVLREKLLGMEMIGRQILTRREFSKIAIVCGVPLNQVSAALEWFSDIGLLLQFEQVGGSLLSSTIVLSPQWLADLFKTIITLKANYVQGGFLLIKDLHHIWKPPSVPPQLHSRCVALLEHFEAVFRFSPDLLLVPALLPREPACISLQKHWPEVSEARFQDLLKTGDWEDCHHARLFTFKTFPPDFFSRLLVRIFRTRLWSPVVLWA